MCFWAIWADLSVFLDQASDVMNKWARKWLMLADLPRPGHKMPNGCHLAFSPSWDTRLSLWCPEPSCKTSGYPEATMLEWSCRHHLFMWKDHVSIEIERGRYPVCPSVPTPSCLSLPSSGVRHMSAEAFRMTTPPATIWRQWHERSPSQDTT